MDDDNDHGFAVPAAVATKSGGGGKHVTPALRRAIWDLYVGIGVKETLCPLCGLNKIQAPSQNSGFEAAHMVARKFLVEELSIFYLVPSCKVCNNECTDRCVLDFLWVRARLVALRRIIMIVYEAFLAHHAHELAPEDCMAWRVLEHLYGPSRHPAGGGIINTKAIYEIARIEQHAALVKQGAALAAQQEALSKQMRALMEVEIRPMKFSGY